MKKHKVVRLTRKWHRYLGVILGIQFLLWTIGGLYFSWVDFDKVKSRDLRKDAAYLSHNTAYIAPSSFLTKYIQTTDSLVSLELTSVLKEPIYRVEFMSKKKKNILLINAVTGELRKTINKQEAIHIAQNRLNVVAPIIDVEYLEKTGKHHEYRKRPLPAYAITFDRPANTTIYVSVSHGNVKTFRNNQWRIFDFLWMLHTMDYRERDNFNNLLLRAFSFFGIFTILSGFLMYILTSKTLNRKKRKANLT